METNTYQKLQLYLLLFHPAYNKVVQLILSFKAIIEEYLGTLPNYFFKE